MIDLYSSILNSFFKEIKKEKNETKALRKLVLLFIIFYSEQENLENEVQQIIDFTLSEFKPIIENFSDNEHEFIFDESVLRSNTHTNDLTILLGEPLIKKILGDQIANQN